MDKLFKDQNGQTVNVVEHTLDILRKYPDVEIHVGTDSQNKKHNTIYVTVIAYRYGTRGVHYIFAKSKVKKIRDLWTRLWKEAEDSINVAKWLTSKINVRIEIELEVEIDLDYNPNKKFDSNKLLSAARGWAQGEGFKVNVKPYNQEATFTNYACKAADHHCRN